ncbi:MAG: signal peptidase II [Clostridiales bacterium]|nr:signal peptidase II [Clostridiales bacterium]
MTLKTQTPDQLDHTKIAGKLLSAILSFFILIGLDQITKHYIDTHMNLYDSISVIPNIFDIHYIRNAGAAWGMFQNQQILFYICTAIVLILGIILYLRCLRMNRYRDLRVLLILILSGAVGNFIDRIRYQYVIDFFYFKLIDFPVFNVADCYVTVGFILLLIIVLFKYKEEDFETLFSFRKHN